VGEPDSAGWDADAMSQFIAVTRPIAKVWFRPEVRGLDAFPPGGPLVVSKLRRTPHHRHVECLRRSDRFIHTRSPRAQRTVPRPVEDLLKDGPDPRGSGTATAALGTVRL
jgi:hypothetical protein